MYKKIKEVFSFSPIDHCAMTRVITSLSTFFDVETIDYLEVDSEICSANGVKEIELYGTKYYYLPLSTYAPLRYEINVLSKDRDTNVEKEVIELNSGSIVMINDINNSQIDVESKFDFSDTAYFFVGNLKEKFLPITLSNGIPSITLDSNFITKDTVPNKVTYSVNQSSGSYFSDYNMFFSSQNNNWIERLSMSFNVLVEFYESDDTVSDYVYNYGFILTLEIDFLNSSMSFFIDNVNGTPLDCNVSIPLTISFNSPGGDNNLDFSLTLVANKPIGSLSDGDTTDSITNYDAWGEANVSFSINLDDSNLEWKIVSDGISCDTVSGIGSTTINIPISKNYSTSNKKYGMLLLEDSNGKFLIDKQLVIQDLKPANGVYPDSNFSYSIQTGTYVIDLKVSAGDTWQSNITSEPEFGVISVYDLDTDLLGKIQIVVDTDAATDANTYTIDIVSQNDNSTVYDTITINITE